MSATIGLTMMGLPQTVGVGFKPCHFDDLLADAKRTDRIGWIEVHAENYMGVGGAPRAHLSALRELMPISLHGVGLSLGGYAPPDKAHLKRLRDLIDWIRPAQISEHLAWAGLPDQFLNDLLPIDYSLASLKRLATHIDMAQQSLGCALLIENPSSYLIFTQNDNALDYSRPHIETDFLSALIEQTGCGLLLDVNNIYVSCFNLGWSAQTYLDNAPLHAVREVHLAGHAEDCDKADVPVLIDNHGAPIAEPVWELYEQLLARCGARPSLVEWDTDIPEWSVLAGECDKARARLEKVVKSASASSVSAPSAQHTEEAVL